MNGLREIQKDRFISLVESVLQKEYKDYLDTDLLDYETFDGNIIYSPQDFTDYLIKIDFANLVLENTDLCESEDIDTIDVLTLYGEYEGINDIVKYLDNKFNFNTEPTETYAERQRDYQREVLGY